MRGSISQKWKVQESAKKINKNKHIFKFQNNVPQCTISKNLNISSSTLQNIMKRLWKSEEISVHAKNPYWIPNMKMYQMSPVTSEHWLRNHCPWTQFSTPSKTQVKTQRCYDVKMVQEKTSAVSQIHSQLKSLFLVLINILNDMQLKYRKSKINYMENVHVIRLLKVNI